MFAQPAPYTEEIIGHPGLDPEVAARIAADEETAQVAAQAKVEKKRYKARKSAAAEAEAEEVALRELIEVTASTVQDERTVWLWKNRLPLGQITLLAGRGSAGKSTVAVQLAAYVTVGDMKGEFFGTPRHVVMVINEDDIPRTVVPRLKAAGANLDLIHFIRMQSITGQVDRVMLPHDIDNVGKLVRKYRAPLVVLDPLASSLTGKRNDNDDVRAAMEAIRNRLADKENCAVLGLAHLRKAASNDILEGLMGASEFGHVARVVLGVVRDPDEEGAIILSLEKSNLGPENEESFRYRLETATYARDDTHEIISTSRLLWLNPTDTKASDIMADRMSGGDGSMNTVQWLKEFLEREGPSTRLECIKAAEKERIGSQRSVDRAKRVLKLNSGRTFRGEATWSLPITPGD